MLRSERIESYLSNECSYKVLDEPDNMEEVDFSTTPIPILKVFYQQGEGNYPKDQDAYFKPPKQDEFAETVYNQSRKYAEGDHLDNFRPETKNAWIQRSKKAWASMVRDVHFAYMMFEYQEKNNSYDKAKFSIDADINEGADFILEKSGNRYHINLFVDSSKSRKFLSKKKNNRQPTKEATDILVPMTFNGPKKSIKTTGENIWIYTRDHVEAVKDIITGENTVKKNDYVLARV